MKMLSGGIKGLGSVLILAVTYIDKTFTPLFWALVILAFIDLVLNGHKEGQQFQKIAAAFLSLGAPSFIAANMANPELGKYIVGILCIVYLQLVVPQVLTKLSKLKLSANKQQNTVDHQAIAAALQLLANQQQNQAQAVVNQVIQPSVQNQGITPFSSQGSAAPIQPQQPAQNQTPNGGV